MRNVYTIGETVFDIIFKNSKPTAAKAGGAMLNTAVSLGRLNLPVYFISDYANDKIGTIIDNFLRDNGVSTNFINKYDDGKTSLSLAFLDKYNNAEYSFYKICSIESINIKTPEIKKDDILLFGSFYSIKQDIRNKIINIVKTAKNNKAIIIYDPNHRKCDYYDIEKLRPIILQNISFADIVRASDEDFSFIFNVNNVEEAFEIVKNNNCSNLIYTQNKNGVFLNTKSIHKKYPVHRIKPKSTIGAGDNFNAGIIFSLLKNNISHNKINTINIQHWDYIIKTSIDFSTHVCMSFDNYISKGFAKKLKFNT